MPNIHCTLTFRFRCERGLRKLDMVVPGPWTRAEVIRLILQRYFSENCSSFSAGRTNGGARPSTRTPAPPHLSFRAMGHHNLEDCGLFYADKAYEVIRRPSGVLPPIIHCDFDGRVTMRYRDKV